MKKSTTSTRPAFIWLFLSTPEDRPDCLPVTLRTEAGTGETARGAFPGINLVFAAKIRTGCSVTSHWPDQDSAIFWSVTGIQHGPEEMRQHFTRLNGVNHA